MTTTDPRDEQAHIPQQAGEPTGPTTTAEQAAPAPRRRRWWIAAAVIAVLAAGGGAAYALIPTDEDRALDRCQSAITGQLTAPSTAQFSEPTIVSEDTGSGRTYRVSGLVDAQNGFGATLQRLYLCEVTRDQQGGWRVTSARIVGG